MNKLFLFLAIAWVQLAYTFGAVCIVEAWAEWQECMGSCQFGLRVRNRRVLRPPFPERTPSGRLAIRPCPELYQVRVCIPTECFPDFNRTSIGAPIDTGPISHPLPVDLDSDIDRQDFGANTVEIETIMNQTANNETTDTSEPPAVNIDTSVDNNSTMANWTLPIKNKTPVPQPPLPNSSAIRVLNSPNVSPKVSVNGTERQEHPEVESSNSAQVTTDGTTTSAEAVRSTVTTTAESSSTHPTTTVSTTTASTTTAATTTTESTTSPPTTTSTTTTTTVTPTTTTETVPEPAATDGAEKLPKEDENLPILRNSNDFETNDFLQQLTPEDFHNPCGSRDGNPRCCRRPLKETCPSGSRPQIVIRWARRAGDMECSSYTYSYCGIRMELEEKPIKFEQTCYELCYSDDEKHTLTLFKNIRFSNGFRDDN